MATPLGSDAGGRRGKYGDDADVADYRHDPVRTALSAIIAGQGWPQ